MSAHPAILITSGEPAGIGPELCAMLAERHRSEPFPARLVVIGDRDLLQQRARRIGLKPRYADYDPASYEHSGGIVEILHQRVVAPVAPGHPDPTNASSVIEMLSLAADACATGGFAALVTAPVQKSTLIDAGFPFVGHTEFFAERTHTPRVVMLLVGGTDDVPLRVALATTHLALRDVPDAITLPVVYETVAIVARELKRRFGMSTPRIAVCGLNPHAGESGHLGREDVDVIAPAVERARREGIEASGPVSADTVFVPDIAQRYDVVVAMYHDQGLPVLKAATFGGGVNVTLGLPFIRTSVDHGTALDLAQDPERAKSADVGSLVAALRLAITLEANARS